MGANSCTAAHASTNFHTCPLLLRFRKVVLVQYSHPVHYKDAVVYTYRPEMLKRLLNTNNYGVPGLGHTDMALT